MGARTRHSLGGSDGSDDSLLFRSLGLVWPEYLLIGMYREPDDLLLEKSRVSSLRNPSLSGKTMANEVVKDGHTRPA